MIFMQTNYKLIQISLLRTWIGFERKLFFGKEHVKFLLNSLPPIPTFNDLA